MNIFIHHVGKDGANRDFPKSIENQVPSQKTKLYKSTFRNGLKNIGDETNIWGVPAGAKPIFDQLNEGDWIFLIGSLNKIPDTQTWESKIRFAFQIVDYTIGIEEQAFDLSKSIWGEPRFPLVVVGQVFPIDLQYSRLLRYIGYKPNFFPSGLFFRVNESRMAMTPEELMEEILSASCVMDKDDLVSQRTTKFVLRAIRAASFRNRVLNVLGRQCAACNFSTLREPSLSSGIEVAHIVPVEYGGQDTIENGIPLCRLHHWAFDNGLITFRVDHERLKTVVHPTRGMYLGQRDWALQQFEASTISLPGDKQYLKILERNLNEHNSIYRWDLS
ncbi:HNH endonuclease [Sulfobacillus thermosulfidooxidans]|uniref:HNH endonuclease n=1 Tax=Sulfobacillus thermosulfidooxidans TaxID=28034 RepID=UPI0003FFDE30|nr:HNH endonuclease [Sulfobacillus thermosulfidooxidans]